jgi:hypothetical protein
MSEIENLRKNADSLLKSKFYQDALALYDQIPEDLQTSSVLVNRSSCCAHLGQYKQAENAARTVVMKYPSLAKVSDELLFSN